MLAPVRTVAPASLPVTLAQAKAQLRVDHTDEDALITALIAAATDHLDGWTGILGRALITQTWRQDFDGFPTRLRLAMFPVASVTSVTYVDGDGTVQGLSSDIYQLLTDRAGAFLTVKPGKAWPGTYNRPDAVTVTYVCGADSAPPAVSAAILMLVAHWYEHREAVTAESGAATLPLAVDRLLKPFRRVGV